jgi:hypothetical protein
MNIAHLEKLTLAGKTKYSEKMRPSDILSSANPAGCTEKKPATNHLSYSTATTMLS